MKILRSKINNNYYFITIQYYLLSKQAKACAPCGGVAQLGEHLPCKQGVRSSILLISTILTVFSPGKHAFASSHTHV